MCTPCGSPFSQSAAGLLYCGNSCRTRCGTGTRRSPQPSNLSIVTGQYHSELNCGGDQVSQLLDEMPTKVAPLILRLDENHTICCSSRSFASYHNITADGDPHRSGSAALLAAGLVKSACVSHLKAYPVHALDSLRRGVRSIKHVAVKHKAV